MRLINADALKEWLGCDGDNKYKSQIMHEIADSIDAQPTVDAEPVVRCKDCVHAGAFTNNYAARRFAGGMNCYLCRGDDSFGMANVSLVYPDDYCSDGVRKEKQDAQV